MKKINLEKCTNIIFFIIIFIIIFSIIVVNPLGDLDEIWNYNTARAVSTGLIPYKDISLITTPFLPICTSIFLKIFGNELIISRILASLLWTGILFLTYKIIKKLTNEENISFIFTAIIGIICRDIFCIDYNATVLLISLFILYLELNDSKNDFDIGILAGIAICTKQSIGCTLAFIVLIYKLLLINNKSEIKKYLKMSIKRLAGILIPVCIMIVYLLITGAFEEFINYAILGIKTFSNKIAYSELFNNEKIEIKILSRLVPITTILTAVFLIISKILKKENIEINKLFTIFIYSFSIIILIYPISDEIHFLVGSLIVIIEIAYIIFLLGKFIYDKIHFKKKTFIYKTITLLCGIALFVITFKYGIGKMYEYIKQDKNIEIEHYKYINISDGLKSRINQIDTYILDCEKQGKNVYILDSDAAVYMIPINKYNKDYDMFLKGNIGKDGEQGQIEKINQRDDNNLYLIRNEKYQSNWQAPKSVMQYIRSNLTKIDQIEIFDVYE